MKSDAWSVLTINDPATPLGNAVRDLMDAVVAADPPQADHRVLVDAVELLTSTFTRHRHPGGPELRLPEVLPHGRIGRVPWETLELTEEILRGRTRFRLVHAGSAHVVHGGAVTFLLDEVMGALANSRVEGAALTAQLDVTFKSATPVDTTLEFIVRLESSGGRKQWLTASLFGKDGTLHVEATGLFITDRP